MARFRNVDWDIPAGDSGRAPKTWEQVQVALLMDIRDELQTLNNVFRCPNALAIPKLLREIKRNTTKTTRKTK